MAWSPTYASTEEFSSYSRIDDSLDDVQIGLALEAASRAVDHTCSRQFGSATGARIYTPYWDAYLSRFVVDIDDLASSAGLVVSVDTGLDGGFATPVTEYSLRPVNAAADGWPWECLALAPGSSVAVPLLPDVVRVSGTFGWPSVPDTVKQATLLQASRLLSRRDAPFGVAGSPDTGSEVRLLARVDPDVAVLLARFTKTSRGFA